MIVQTARKGAHTALYGGASRLASIVDAVTSYHRPNGHIMQDCRDISWLRMRDREELYLSDKGRMGRILKELKDLGKQWPSFQVFVGHQTKDAALRDIFLQNNIKKTSNVGGLNLRVDNNI